MSNDKQYVEQVLAQYNIQAELLQQYGKVWRVGTKNGTFALKKINKHEAYGLFMNIHTMYQRGIQSIVPIYKTNQGYYYVEDQQHVYYLMPWIEAKEEREVDFKDSLLFKELAKLHSLTVQEKEYEEKDITDFYEKTSGEWKRNAERLEKYVDECEKKIYMSPFELQVCTAAHEISLANKFANSQLDTWYEEMKEDKKHRTSFTHGRISFHHFLKDEQGRGYFTSWERSRKAPPANDVVSFYHRYLSTYPLYCDECVDWYYEYQKEFPLRETEQTLALCHLSYPKPFMNVFNGYLENKKNKRNSNEREAVRKLQDSYWLAKNIEYVAGRINQIETQKKNSAQT